MKIHQKIVTHGFDVAMEESDFVDALDGFENLQSQSETGRERKGSPGLGAAQFGQVAALQLHDDIVEPIVAAASDEAADVLFAWKKGKQMGKKRVTHTIKTDKHNRGGPMTEIIGPTWSASQ